MRAIVIVDLGFGDAGKGLLTDFLVRRTGAALVVRYNGGAQAGHNVVTPDGRHHTFSQFGSGSFVPGLRTFLSSDVVVHPTALLREASALRSVGVADAMERLRIGAGATVITPYHQALGRLREIARGAARHGSCGVGVGEAVAHAGRAPQEAIRFSDITDAIRLRRKLAAVRDHVMAEVETLELRKGHDSRASLEFEVLSRPEAAEEWVRCASRVAHLAADDEEWLSGGEEFATVIFEGAQGILLDESHGFHPYTSWSCCTSSRALNLIAQFSPRAEVCTIGVLRTFAVRHGAGPFPTETPAIRGTSSDHNTFNEWQGEMRRGWFDGRLARYAIEADGSIDGLAVTHLDWLSRIRKWRYCTDYRPDIDLGFGRSLAERQGVTTALASVQPVIRECTAREEDVLATIEEVVGKPVLIGSRGPSAPDVLVRDDSQLFSRGATRSRQQSYGGEAWP